MTVMAYRLDQTNVASDEPSSPGKPRRPLRERSIAVLPTLFTLGNLLCGFMAVFVASRQGTEAPLVWNWTALTVAAVLVFIGMLFDALDGRIARLTQNTSDLGEQLDSMADMVTFGIAPAFIGVQLMANLVDIGIPFFSGKRDPFFGRLVLVLAGIYVCCTALRLARFNAEIEHPGEADHLSFKGLPSPGAAGTIAALVLLQQHLVAQFLRLEPGVVPHPNADWLVTASSIAILLIVLLTAFAMVSRLRYPHVINRYIRGRARIRTLVAIVVCLLLIMIWPQPVLAFGFCLYAASAPAASLWRRTARAGRHHGAPAPGGGETDHVRVN